VGLVVFAGTAFLQVPLSADYEVLNEFLPSLNPAFMPVGGTNYDAMLRAVLDAFSASGTADRYLIILSDGESQTEGWRDLVGDLRAKNIRVIGLGVGTAQGAFIPDEGGGYLKDARGAVVLSKLNSTTLQELAAATNGVYTDASTWVDLGALLTQTVAAGRRGEFKERIQARQLERFQWALAPALFCLLLSLWREFPVRPRVRSLPLAGDIGHQKPDAGERPAEAGKAAAAAAAALLLLLSGLRSPVSAIAAEDTSAYAAPLSKLVERLSAQPELSAGDCATLARETITWGQRVRGAGQAVMPGPVHDALAGVDAGERLAAQAADWPQLRQQLEELLKKPPEPPPQPQPQEQQQQQSQSQQQEQQNQAQKPEPKPQNQPEPPKPNTGETQKVGGQPQRPQEAKNDPSMVLPIQKLDQLRNQDSPAELFQMLDSHEHKPTPKQGPNW
jgi:Ca-activated chloride channel family protein